MMFASSAPLAPALALAITLKSMLFEHLMSLACNLRMASRPARSGSSTGILLSKRPGRVKAGSNESGRFVAIRHLWNHQIHPFQQAIGLMFVHAHHYHSCLHHHVFYQWYQFHQ